jgi:hypothetical protein
MAALFWEAKALIGLGRLAEVNARIAEGARVPVEASGPVLLDLLVEIGRDLRAHGYRKEARAFFERGTRWIESRPAAEQGDLRGDLAQLLSDAEHYDQAWLIVKQLAAERPDDVDLQASLGAVAARRSDLKEVTRIDRWLAGRNGPYLRGWPTFQRARLAAILGDTARAFRLYRQAVGEGNWLRLDRMHADPDFESLRDYPPFQEFTRPRD